MAKQGVHINVTTNVEAVRKRYVKLQKHELPKHWGYAITDTAKKLALILNRNTRSAFDKPNSLTKSSFGYVRARSTQKTIEEKKAWVGRKGAVGLPLKKVQGTKTKASRDLSFKRTMGVYKDLWERQTYGGIRKPKNNQYLLYPSKHSSSMKFTQGRAGTDLNFKRLKSAQNDTANFFTGIPKNGQQGSKWRGIWKRIPGKGKPGTSSYVKPRIKMVASQVTTQSYNKKPFKYNRYVQTAMPRLIRTEYAKQMRLLRASLRRSKIKKMRKIRGL
jgi:hypothetical protein|tara:strand:+ start:41 stop:862 length:822 start_codon:yes stop_codon:yes gene_type:complete